MSKRRGAAPKEQQRRSGHRRLPIFFSSFLEGILQATRLDVAIAAVSRSETARAAALQCLGFNGLLLVSLVAWRWVVAPAAAAAATAAQGHTPFPPLLSALAAAFFAPRAEDDRSSPPLELLATFILGWVFPASAMALSLSGPWCLAVAKGVFEEGGSRRGRGGSRGSGRSRSRSRSRAARTTANGSPSRGATRSPPPTTAGEETAAASSSSSSAEAEALELYRGTLFGALWAQAGLSRLAPLPGSLAFAGPLVSTLLTWLLYGLMAFDYRFTAESERLRGGRARSAAAAAAAVGVADRFAAFGRAWPFYLAFGLVAASPSLVLPFWEGMAAVAALYPLFVALAASGRAAPAPEEDISSSQVPPSAARRFSLLSVVFSPAIVVTDLVVSVLTPLAWRAGGRAAMLLGLRGEGKGQRRRQR